MQYSWAIDRIPPLQKAIKLVAQMDPIYVPEEWKQELESASQKSLLLNEKLIISKDTHLGRLTIAYYMSTGTLHLQGAELIIQLTSKITQGRYDAILQGYGVFRNTDIPTLKSILSLNSLLYNDIFPKGNPNLLYSYTSTRPLLTHGHLAKNGNVVP